MRRQTGAATARPLRRLSADTRSRSAGVLPWIVLLLAVSVRLWWGGQKETLYGDELTSVCLAYDQPGWGAETFPPDSVRTGREWREAFCTDDAGGLDGLAHDLRALHADNRDGSHASLYYMLLRCALTGTDVPEVHALVTRGLGLNLCLFLLSFAGLWRLLRHLYPGRNGAVALGLLLASLSPAAVSTTLLVREYQLAECVFAWWACWWLESALRWRGGHGAARPGGMAWGAVLGALLLSSGYFNALFMAFTLAGLPLLAQRGRRAAALGVCAGVGAASLLLSVGLYSGFFHFLTDIRTAEVAQKAGGAGAAANLLTSLQSGAVIAVRMLFTPVGAAAAVAWVAAWAASRRVRSRWRSLRPSGGAATAWLLGSAWAWAAVVLLLAPWKEPRYVAPAVPLLLLPLAAVLREALFRRGVLATAAVAAAFLFPALHGRDVRHVYHLADCPWPEAAPRVLLYGPNADERNTLLQLFPYLSDTQEAVAAEHVADIPRLAGTGARTVPVFGPRGCAELLASPLCRGESPFNDWTSRYDFALPAHAAPRQP